MSLATGNKTRRSSGFTLLEMSVVLGVMSIVLAMILPAFGNQYHSYLMERETDRLLATLRATHTDAVVNGREWQMSVSPSGYVFQHYDYDTAAWIEADALPFAAHTLPDSLSLSTEIHASAQPSSFKGASSENGVFLFSSGETTPFTLKLIAKSGTIRSTEIDADGSSGIHLHSEQP